VRGGRPLVGYLERTLPPWIDGKFARDHELDSRDRVYGPRLPRGSRADQEMAWYLSNQYFARIFGCVSTFAREEGVEIRSPLYDRRVIDFALTRPRRERSTGRETKTLLRAAMKGLLPDNVLQTRTVRTGVTGGYFARSMRERLPAMVDEMFGTSALAELGVIDARAYRQAVSAYARGMESNFAVPLYLTLQTELWLRAHSGDGTSRALKGSSSFQAAL